MKDGVTIRRAREGDIDAICDIERAAFPGPTAYSRRQLRYLVMRAHGESLVAVRDGAVCGYAIVLHRRGSDVSGLESLAVHPDRRGEGLGKALLEGIELVCRRRGDGTIRIEVSERNGAAIRLYRESGYLTVGRLENFYVHRHHGTRHALRMVKALG